MSSSTDRGAVLKQLSSWQAERQRLSVEVNDVKGAGTITVVGARVTALSDDAEVTFSLSVTAPADSPFVKSEGRVTVSLVGATFVAHGLSDSADIVPSPEKWLQIQLLPRFECIIRMCAD
ncbi:MAG: hypothetical protein WCF57_09070 [Pyrinomonadaceae bacterium]